MDPSSTRRRFLQLAGASAAALNFGSSAIAKDNPKVIQGFEKAARDPDASKGWKPDLRPQNSRRAWLAMAFASSRRAFGFQDHPNVEVVAVSDLIPERCAELAKACALQKTYPSLEELVKDDRISKRSSSPPTRRATPGTASKCSSMASMSPLPCRRASAPWKKPSSFSKP